MNDPLHDAVLLTPEALGSPDALAAVFAAAASRAAAPIGVELHRLADGFDRIGSTAGPALRRALSEPIAPFDVAAAARVRDEIQALLAAVPAAELAALRAALQVPFEGSPSAIPAGAIVPAQPAAPDAFLVSIEGVAVDAAPIVLPDTVGSTPAEPAAESKEATAAPRATRVWGNLPWLQWHLTELCAKCDGELAALARDNPATFGAHAFAKLANWTHFALFAASAGNRRDQLENVAELLQELGLPPVDQRGRIPQVPEQADDDELGSRDDGAWFGVGAGGSGQIPRALRDVIARLGGALVIVIEAARALALERDDDERRTLTLRVDSVETLVRRCIRTDDAARQYLRARGIPVPGDAGVEALETPRLRGRLTAGATPIAQLP